MQNLLTPVAPGLPPGPSGDAALAMAGDPLRFIEDTTRQYGGFAGFKLAGENVVLVSDP